MKHLKQFLWTIFWGWCKWIPNIFPLNSLFLLHLFVRFILQPSFYKNRDAFQTEIFIIKFIKGCYFIFELMPLGKGINRFIQFHAAFKKLGRLGSLALVSNQLRKRATLNWNPRRRRRVTTPLSFLRNRNL